MEQIEISGARKLAYSSLCLALAVILPVFTGQTEVLGQTLLPMHFAIILCAFLSGTYYAGVVGLMTPFFRFVLFGTPAVFPLGVSIALELTTYGFVVGYLFEKYQFHNFDFINKKNWSAGKKQNINFLIVMEITMLISMVLGRAVWGLAMFAFTSALGGTFNFSIFVSGAIIAGIPGVVCQLIIIPIIVLAFKKAKIV